MFEEIFHKVGSSGIASAATNETPCTSRFISWATLLLPLIADSFEAPFNGRSRLDTQTRQELSYGGAVRNHWKSITWKS